MTTPSHKSSNTNGASIMVKPSHETNDNEYHDEFTRAIPDESLYKHYAFDVETLRRMRKDGVPSFEYSYTCGNPGCQFIPLHRTASILETELEYELEYELEDELDNEMPTDKQNIELLQKCIDACNRIEEADKDSRRRWNEYYKHADWMQALFNVDSSIFNHKHDRQCEIHERILQGSYMVSALRSFAWTLSDYCERKGITPSDISSAEVHRLVKFIADHDWLNYDNTSHCRALCDAPDINVFYMPDKSLESDLKLIPNGQQLLEDSHISDIQLGPSHIRSLEGLRRDLAFIYPPIRLLFEELAKNRNYSEHLSGDEADLVYAWCVFTFAADYPFSLEITLLFYIYPKYMFERIDNETDSWFRTYKKYFSKKRVIKFHNKRFFFCDLDAPYDAREHPTVWKVVEYGGIRQACVTSLTDYLVVNPPPPHRIYTTPGAETSVPERTCNTWLSVADRYRQHGKRIHIVLQKDVEEALKSYIPPAHSLEDTPNDSPGVSGVAHKKRDLTPQTDSQLQAISEYANKARLVPESDLVINEFGTLVTYKGKDKHIILPDGIKAIAKEAFYFNDTVVSVILPEGIQDIGRAAFGECCSLRHTTLPGTLRKIEREAFENCTSLTSIVIPEGVTRIGVDAFSYCRTLKHVKLPSTLRMISRRTFQYCLALTHVDMAEGIETIEDFAFSDCYSIREIHFPNTLRKIGFCAFSLCSSLESIDIPEGVKSIPVAFSHCERLKHVSFSTVLAPEVPFTFGIEGADQVPVRLPGSLSRIDEESFSFCHSLEEIDIPEGVRSIDPAAFEGCISLRKVTLPSTLREIGDYAFFGCSGLANIKIPNGVEEIGDNAFGRCPKLKDVHIPASVKTIGENAFDK